MIIRHREKPSYEKTEKLALLTLGEKKKKKDEKEGYDESVKMANGKEKIDQELL